MYRHRFENNFVELSKQLRRKLKHDENNTKSFEILLNDLSIIIFGNSIKLLSNLIQQHF